MPFNTSIIQVTMQPDRLGCLVNRAVPSQASCLPQMGWSVLYYYYLTYFFFFCTAQHKFSSVAHCIWLFPTPWTAACQATLQSTALKACSNSCTLSWWCHPKISSSFVPFSSCLQTFQNQGLIQGVSSLHQVAKVLEFQLQDQSFQWIFRTDFL